VRSRPIELTSATPARPRREGVRNAAALAVVALVVVAAAANSLLSGHGGAAPQKPATRPPPAPPKLPRGMLRGELWYADSACRLHRVDLWTERASTLQGPAGYCNFWVSPNRRLVAMRYSRPLIPPRPLAVMDVRTGRITTPFTEADLGFAPPAWSPDSHTLVTCDGSHGVPELRAFHTTDGRVTTAVSDACFPGYVGARLAYRDLDGVAHIGRRSVAGAGALTGLLRQHVDQTPGPAAAGDVLAVPATTVTIAGGPAPIMVVVVYDRKGRAVGEWDTGAVADSIALLGGGRVITASRRAGLVLDVRLTGEIITSLAKQPIIAAAVSPDRSVLALSNRSDIVFTDMAGRPRWSLPGHTRWIQWTP
jgi:hypothetical protein